ncbi:hypothetical protein EV360DRAFT_85661 [Lentinula raphanica]|nr:hypothetical protein EV360DRAFT_85661 [Lentinula raphanica]
MLPPLANTLFGVFIALCLFGLFTHALESKATALTTSLSVRDQFKTFVNDMKKKGLLEQIDDNYRYTAEESKKLSRTLHLSSSDYGQCLQNQNSAKVWRMAAGSGTYEGHGRTSLIIKSLPAQKHASTLGEIKALEIVGDLVDFGTDPVQGRPTIIMKRKTGLQLYETEEYKKANYQQKKKLAMDTARLGCMKGAQDAFHKGVWHNDNHMYNILVTFEKGAVISVELIDYGEGPNFLVYGEARSPHYMSIFYDWCIRLYGTPIGF